jgi:hypothetical protein
MAMEQLTLDPQPTTTPGTELPSQLPEMVSTPNSYWSGPCIQVHLDQERRHALHIHAEIAGSDRFHAAF